MISTAVQVTTLMENTVQIVHFVHIVACQPVLSVRGRSPKQNCNLFTGISFLFAKMDYLFTNVNYVDLKIKF